MKRRVTSSFLANYFNIEDHSKSLTKMIILLLSLVERMQKYLLKVFQLTPFSETNKQILTRKFQAQVCTFYNSMELAIQTPSAVYPNLILAANCTSNTTLYERAVQCRPNAKIRQLRSGDFHSKLIS